MISAISRAMPRAIFPGALALTGAMLALAPVQAHAGTTGAYWATLQTPVAAPRQEILDSTLWKCAGDSCSAFVSGSRPLFICQRVVKKLGPVARFATPAGEFSAEDLNRCNGH